RRRHRAAHKWRHDTAGKWRHRPAHERRAGPGNRRPRVEDGGWATTKSSAMLRLKGCGCGEKYKAKREHDDAKKAGHISALLLKSSYRFRVRNSHRRNGSQRKTLRFHEPPKHAGLTASRSSL